MRRSSQATLALLFCLAVLATASFAAAADDDGAEIRQVISTQFDKPDHSVVIDPVVVEGDHAIAGWTQGERGGRALLRRSEGKWRVVLCGGDALKVADALAQTGIAAAPAAALAGKPRRRGEEITARTARTFLHLRGPHANDLGRRRAACGPPSIVSEGMRSCH